MSEGREFSPATQKAAIETAILCIRGATKSRASERDLLCEQLRFIHIRITRAEARANAPAPVRVDDVIVQIERLLRVCPGGDVKASVQNFVDGWRRKSAGEC